MLSLGNIVGSSSVLERLWSEKEGGEAIRTADDRKADAEAEKQKKNNDFVTLH